jgi:hypothetical protein
MCCLAAPLAVVLGALGCARNEPPGAQPHSLATVTALASVPSVPSAPPVAASDASVGHGDDADALAPRPDATQTDSCASSDGAVDWTNKSRPDQQSPLLAQHGKALLEAIATDDPEIARDFFFPREPFRPLKNVADADRYWRQLYATYSRDLHELHRKRADWTGATYESFELGTSPTWVKPGDEYNKIGYFRTFRSRLTYKMGDRAHSIEVHTIISWNNDWYITHLLAFKRK